MHESPTPGIQSLLHVSLKSLSDVVVVVVTVVVVGPVVVVTVVTVSPVI